MRWLKTVATTHFLLLDMPPHQLPARSQILHRVSTGGSETSELRTHLPRRPLIAARGRPPTMQAIEDADSTPVKRRSSARQSSPQMTPRTKARTTSSNPPSPIQDATPSGIGSFQKVNVPSSHLVVAVSSLLIRTN